jgi:hypothetical protein
MEQGYRVTRVLGPRAQAALTQEALRCEITEAYLDRSPDEELRRGNPARHLHTAVGGASLRALYGSTTLGTLLRRLTGRAWAPSAQLGTYSYYCRAGHHLDLHRDVDTCDLAVIACLYEHGAPAAGIAGAICRWPGSVPIPSRGVWSCACTRARRSCSWAASCRTPSRRWRTGTRGSSRRSASGRRSDGRVVSDLPIARRTVSALRSLGVRIALDDLGTWHSSLQSLRELPVDIIKVAKPFTEGAARSLEALRSLGCELGQGYLLGRPVQMPVAAAVAAFTG